MNRTTRCVFSIGWVVVFNSRPCREVPTMPPNQNVSMFAAASAGVFTKHHAFPLAI